MSDKMLRIAGRGTDGLAKAIQTDADGNLHVVSPPKLEVIFAESLLDATTRYVELTMIEKYSDFDFMFQNALLDVSNNPIEVAIGFYLNEGNAHSVLLSNGSLALYKEGTSTTRHIYHKVPAGINVSNRVYLSQIQPTFNIPVVDNVETDVVPVLDHPWKLYKKNGSLSDYTTIHIGITPLAIPVSGSFKVIIEGRD